MAKGNILRSIFGALIKVFILSIAMVLVLTILTSVIIGIVYNESFFVLFSDHSSQFSSEIQQYFSANFITVNIFRKLPLITEILGKKVAFIAEIVMNVVDNSDAVNTALHTESYDYQRELFAEMYFSVFVADICAIIIHLYNAIKKLIKVTWKDAGNLAEKLIYVISDISILTGIVFLSSAYAVMLSDYFLDFYFKKNPILAFVVLLSLIVLVSIVKSLLSLKKSKNTNGKKLSESIEYAAFNVLKSLILTCLIYLAILSVSALTFSSYMSSGAAFVVVITSIISILAISILVALWFGSLASK